MTVLCIEELTEGDLRILAGKPARPAAPLQVVLPSARVVEQALDDNALPASRAATLRATVERPS